LKINNLRELIMAIYQKKILEHTILFVVYYSIVTPIGFVLRLFGTDLLKLKFDKNKTSYWEKKL
jgi:hypothetical protein